MPRALTDWSALLRELDRGARLSDPASQLPMAWTLHGWANDHLDSAAIRLDGTEGLIGPAPARWRLLVHIESGPDQGLAHSSEAASGFAVAVLDGRAPLRPSNVLASLLVAPKRQAIITVRAPAPPAKPAPFDDDVRQGIASSGAALAALVDLALGRCARVSGSAAALPISPAPGRLADPERAWRRAGRQHPAASRNQSRNQATAGLRRDPRPLGPASAAQRSRGRATQTRPREAIALNARPKRPP